MLLLYTTHALCRDFRFVYYNYYNSILLLLLLRSFIFFIWWPSDDGQWRQRLGIRTMSIVVFYFSSLHGPLTECPVAAPRCPSPSLSLVPPLCPQIAYYLYQLNVLLDSLFLLSFTHTHSCRCTYTIIRTLALSLSHSRLPPKWTYSSATRTIIIIRCNLVLSSIIFSLAYQEDLSTRPRDTLDDDDGWLIELLLQLLLRLAFLQRYPSPPPGSVQLLLFSADRSPSLSLSFRHFLCTILSLRCCWCLSADLIS